VYSGLPRSAAAGGKEEADSQPGDPTGRFASWRLGQSSRPYARSRSPRKLRRQKPRAHRVPRPPETTSRQKRTDAERRSRQEERSRQADGERGRVVGLSFRGEEESYYRARRPGAVGLRGPPRWAAPASRQEKEKGPRTSIDTDGFFGPRAPMRRSHSRKEGARKLLPNGTSSNSTARCSRPRPPFHLGHARPQRVREKKSISRIVNLGRNRRRGSTPRGFAERPQNEVTGERRRRARLVGGK